MDWRLSLGARDLYEAKQSPSLLEIASVASPSRMAQPLLGMTSLLVPQSPCRSVKPFSVHCDLAQFLQDLRFDRLGQRNIFEVRREFRPIASVRPL